VHCCVQHSFAAEHGTPSSLQFESALQWPLRSQDPAQHSDEVTHAVPLDLHVVDFESFVPLHAARANAKTRASPTNRGRVRVGIS